MLTRGHQAPDEFIGRTNEIDLFLNWLLSPDHPWILYLHDKFEEKERKGGVGKTWLLRKFAQLARQQTQTIVVMVDFFNVADRDGIAIAEHVVHKIQESHPEWQTSSFNRSLDEYRAVINRGNIDVEDIREQLSFALTADLEKLEGRLKETNSYLLLLFDTFELIEQNPLVAVLLPSQLFPDNYHFPRMKAIIAGRNTLDWSHPNWHGREHEVHSVAIAPFNLEEMTQYINNQSVITLDASAKQAAKLYERTEGRPILIGLVADVLNHQITSVEELITIPRDDFTAHLISRVDDLENPVNWVILFMAHAYHRFNIDLLNSILSQFSLVDLAQGIQGTAWLETLLKLSFVRRPDIGNDFVLHDEMAHLVTRYWWDTQDLDWRYRHDVSRGTINYYQQQITQEQNEQVRQVHMVEMLYHMLVLDISDGLRYFEQQFSRAIDIWLTAFARSLLQETQKFTGSMSSTQISDLLLAEAKLLRKEEEPAAALAIHQKQEVETEPEWLEAHRAERFYEQGSCYLQMSRLTEAIVFFEQCMGLETSGDNEEHLAEILLLLGLIHRRQGKLQTAIRFYENSLAIHQKLGNVRAQADVLTNIANLYRLQGKAEEALRRCKVALYVRKDLFQQNKASEVVVGLSTSTMGVIYLDIDDLVSAENAFREAREIFIRSGYKKGIAATSNRFGQIEMARDNLSQAMEWLKKGYAASLGIDKEAQINSLNKQGQVLVLQDEPQNSLPFFREATALAREVHDYYQLAETLFHLATALERLGQQESSQQTLKEAEDIAQRYNYNLLLGMAEELRGDYFYQAGDYRHAFEHYGAYCYYTTLYNLPKYNKALLKLVDRLLMTPKNEIPAITTTLTEYWSLRKLAITYPDLVSVCKDIQNLLHP
jgi:tetratricopeptide (TPR) repeat protein